MTRAAIAGAFALAACASGPRDVVPTTHDVQVQGVAAQGGYLRVARRPTGFVALSSEQGLGVDAAAAAVERLADAMDACATDLARKGKLVDGAIRVVAIVRADGSIEPSNVTVAPGDAVAANALLCVLAPLKLTTFPPSDARRSIALDATWGPRGAAD